MTFEGAYASVAVEGTAFCYDAPYDYVLPPHLLADAVPGCLVRVPFGSETRHRLGVLLARHNQPTGRALRAVVSLEGEATLPPDLVALIPWLKTHCFCTLHEAARVMLPAGLHRKFVRQYALVPPEHMPPAVLLVPEEQTILTVLQKRRSREPYIPREALLQKCGFPADSPWPEALEQKGYLVSSLAALQAAGPAQSLTYALGEDSALAGKHSAKQQLVIDFLQQNGSATLRELCGYLALSPAVPQALAKRGVLVKSWQASPPAAPLPTPPNPAPLVLNAEQQAVFDHLRQAHKPVALLFGITGSGKTSVYMRLLDETLAAGQGAIVLVPEIALTPQLLALFQARYGGQAVLYHSGLSLGERTAAWQRIRKGEARLVLGTRSAVFAPLDRIGLIIIDEEHEACYKSEQSPRYHARSVAKARARQHKALLLLGSATPSLGSYAKALAGRYQLERLTARYGNAQLPQVRTVDLPTNDQLLSHELLQALQTVLARGEQAILLMNRRGYHTFLVCRQCKQSLHCPHCSISLAWHLASQQLQCHYCGHQQPVPRACPQCGGEAIRFGGAGTQKLAFELSERLPMAKVARLDADSTRRRHAREEVLTAFAQGTYNVLIGTQMVAKGLDFPRVTLVGVVMIDQQLYVDDYRSLERCFSLLTQVAGRAGRANAPGQVILQTLNPNNNVLQLAAQQDYPQFFATELPMRRAMAYPPYCAICRLGVWGADEPQVKAACKVLLDLLRQATQPGGAFAGEKVIVLGPGPERVSRISDTFRWRLLVKCSPTDRARALLAALLVQMGKDKRFASITVFADWNPEGLG